MIISQILAEDADPGRNQQPALSRRPRFMAREGIAICVQVKIAFPERKLLRFTEEGHGLAVLGGLLESAAR